MEYYQRELAERIEQMECFNQEQFALAHERSSHQRSHNTFSPFSVGFKRIGSGSALCAGADSPLTQSFGLGMLDFQEQQVDDLEAFCAEHAVPVNVEASHAADIAMFNSLAQRGYTMIERSFVFARHLKSTISLSSTKNGSVIRPCRPDEVEQAMRVIAGGFFGSNEPSSEGDALVHLLVMWMHQPNAQCVVAELDGSIVGGGSLFIHDGLAMLGGASVIPAHRGHGIQTALVNQRLQIAYEAGCDAAFVVTEPYTISQRTVQSHGFVMVSARTKFHRAFPSSSV
jgi:GNAT superfamily N-acetyltransferase